MIAFKAIANNAKLGDCIIPPARLKHLLNLYPISLFSISACLFFPLKTGVLYSQVDKKKILGNEYRFLQ